MFSEISNVRKRSWEVEEVEEVEGATAADKAKQSGMRASALGKLSG
jgi:hypothetical protein